jgi:hypothetical protein
MEIEYENCRLIRFQKKSFSLSVNPSLCPNSNKKGQTLLLEFKSNLSKLFDCSISIKYKRKNYPQIKFHKWNDWIFTLVSRFSLKCSEGKLYLWCPKGYYSVNDRRRVLSCLHSYFSTFCLQNGSVSCKGIDRLKGFTWKDNWNLESVWKSL